jgi:hypothetical protein
MGALAQVVVVLRVFQQAQEALIVDIVAALAVLDKITQQVVVVVDLLPILLLLIPPMAVQATGYLQQVHKVDKVDSLVVAEVELGIVALD